METQYALKAKAPLRQRPHVWTTFWKLNCDELFFVGKVVFKKNFFLTASEAFGGNASMIIPPWRRVRTMRLRNPNGPLRGSSESFPDAPPTSCRVGVSCD